jgi:4-alpha-glucanotransferase
MGSSAPRCEPEPPRAQGRSGEEASSEPRRAGLLLHPTCLGGRFGIGDLGPEAEAFLQWAAAAGQSVWQVLPLGRPPGRGNCPYSPLSAFAGNPLLISPERLAEEGLLTEGEVVWTTPAASQQVDFVGVRAWKEALLRSAFEQLRLRAPAAAVAQLEAFEAEAAVWLEDWALFATLRSRFRGEVWTEWPSDLRRRDPAALARARQELGPEIAYHRFVQFLFFRQWRRLREVARRLGILLLGDLPFYLDQDSVDTWVHPHLFELSPEGRPLAVSGLPPDPCSATGQIWGHPLYRWDRHRQEGYGWWIRRMRAQIDLVDLLRIDHFPAFDAYWRVPAEAATAQAGHWVPGPGLELFRAAERALGRLALVAEDLGILTANGRRLLNDLGLPRMKVLQFAFSEADSDHLPHRVAPNSVVYTGTHDNDTSRGWFAQASTEERRRALDYLGGDGSAIEWDLIRAAYTSAARLAVVPVQDVLGLGSEARMNIPGRARGNWRWRVPADAFTPQLAERLRQLAEVSGRLPPAAEAASGGAGGGPSLREAPRPGGPPPAPAPKSRAAPGSSSRQAPYGIVPADMDDLRRLGDQPQC